MPQTEPKKSPKLGIRLDGNRISHAPGDTVTGYVFRTAHAVSSKASVQISLHGRSKSRIIVKRGHTSRTSRGRFDLLKAADNTQSLYEGPLHIPPGGEEVWPFSITLPTHLDPAALAPGVPQEQSYIQLKSAEVATHVLPSTFLVQDYGFGQGMEAFVEYFLQAELKTASRGSTDVSEAVLPLKVARLDRNLPAEGHQLKTSRHTRGISSQRRMSAAGNAGPSGSPGATERRGSSSVPGLVFNIQVQVPTFLQIDKPEPIPFLVLATPDWSKCSKDVEAKGIPTEKMSIAHLSLNIVSVTDASSQGTRSVHHTNNETKTVLYSQEVEDDLGQAVSIPWAEDVQPGGGRDDQPPPVNVGEKANIRMSRAGLLYPDFTTYNIRHSHRLNWEMVVHIAGEELTISGLDAVTVLAAGDASITEWIQPPAEIAEPPSFVEAVEEQETPAMRRVSRPDLWDF